MKNYSYFMGQDGFSWFVGVVEDRDDPHRLGRVRVRALGYHTEDKTKEIILRLLKDEFPKPGSVKNRKNNAPATGKTTLLELKNA